MEAATSLHTDEEVSRLGHELFDRVVKPKLNPDDARKFVIIDVDSGDYECDADGYTAAMRLLSRRPNADTWLTRGDGSAARLRIAR